MNKDIAIIGIGVRFPETKDLDDLYNHLKEGKDLVSQISKKRITDTTLPENEQYMHASYIEDIDKFDHNFFNISLAEAQTMDPHQRLLLEVVNDCIENAGYNSDFIKGSNTAVYVGEIDSDYYKHADDYSPTLVSGNAREFYAGRISRCFDLKGASSVVNASCASTLVALHMACNELIVKDADQALVCGGNLYLFPFLNGDANLQMFSPDGRSRSFSADANGMGKGEIICSVLLKPLEKAIQDKDIIHAVIKSIAVNSNGGRASSPTAPDGISQSEVIKTAWKKVGINPEDIGYIEGHGSGTQLGDSLEIEGLTLAFNEFTNKKKFCALSSMKTNVGHCIYGAGLAGLIRVILSFKNKVIFPTVHYNKPNPLIDFEKTAVYISNKFTDWNVELSKKRLAGLTSSGFSGTNAHVVLEEYVNISKEDVQNSKTLQIITHSSKTQHGLIQNLKEIYRKIQLKDDLNIENIAYTLNTGRKQHEYKFACIVDELENLKKQLQIIINDESKIDEYQKNRCSKIIFLLSDTDGIPDEFIQCFLKNFPVFAKEYQRCLEYSKIQNQYFIDFAFQFSLYKLLVNCGLKGENVLATGIGKIIYSVVFEEISLKQGIEKLFEYIPQEITEVNTRVDKLLAREANDQSVIFLHLGKGNEISNAIRDRENTNALVYHFCDINIGDNALLLLFKFLYLNNYEIDWNKFYKDSSARKIELPTYQFEKTHCWLRDAPRILNTSALITTSENEFLDDTIPFLNEVGNAIEEHIALIWCKTLKIKNISLNDNFFELGGDSLATTKVINQINKEFDLKLSFEDIFDFPTIKEFCNYIDSIWSTEQKLIAIWKDVLKAKNITKDSNFFELGGHSLIASQIIYRIKKIFQIELNFEDIFYNPKLSQLSELIDKLIIDKSSILDNAHKFDNTKKDETKITLTPSISRKIDIPLSFAQTRLWILDQLDHNSSYNIPGAIRLLGKIKTNILEKTFLEIINRHDILRTNFVTVNNIPRQIIHKKTDFKLKIEDLSHLSKIESETLILDLIEKESEKVFDLEKYCLIRAILYIVSGDESILFLNKHHIITDGWSYSILINEISILYETFSKNKPSPLKKLPIQYADYSIWQSEQVNGELLKKQSEYWKNKLKGLTLLELPIDKIRPKVQTFNGNSIPIILDKSISDKLNLFSNKNNVTLFMTFLTMIKILLHKYSGQDDICVGTPIANRNSSELESLIGLFVNTLALRSKIETGKTFIEFLNEIKTTTLDAYRNQDMPFEKIVDVLEPERNMAYSPIFQTFIAFQNFPESELTMSGIHIEPFSFKSTISKFDLRFEFFETKNGIEGIFEYNTDLFLQSTIERMINHFYILVNSLLENPQLQIKEIEILTPEEKHQLLVEWNDTSVEYLKDKTIIDLFEQQVEKTPNTMAVVFEQEKLTYQELNEKANQLGHFLQKKGVKPEALVAICLERSLGMIVGLLGILKAGGAYVPIDPNYPKDRIYYMLEDCECKLLLTTNKNKTLFTENQIEKIYLNDTDFLTATSQLSIENVSSDITSNNLVYVIYTSGSTGKPKGALIEHYSLVNRLNWMQQNYPLCENDVILQKTTYTFDVSVWELFWWGMYGATLCLLKPGGEKEPETIIKTIEEKKVTTIHFVPSMYKLFLDHINSNTQHQRVSTIKYIFCSGEMLSVDLVKQSSSLIENNGTKLINLYGPTEATIDVTYYNCNVNDISIPIGKPISNTQMYVLDNNRLLCPVGVPGELYIAGDGLARGYLKRDELNNEKFISNPYYNNNSSRLYKTGDLARWLPDGNIEYLGRIDHQVKVRGFRIELGEIESALNKVETIKDCVVVAKDDKFGNKHLVAYIVPSTKEGLNIEQIREKLLKSLPDYMIPSLYVKLDSIPLTPNGKINRKVLPEPDGNLATTNEYVAPRTEVEKQLVQIWKEVLGIEKVGIYNNFFELGGHSLLATQVISKIRMELNYNLPLKVIFEHNTILSLAEQIINFYEKNTVEKIEKNEKESFLKINLTSDDVEIEKITI